MKRIIPVMMVLIALMMLPSALADVLTLPASLNTIEEEAFYGNKSLDKVVLGENVTTIGPRAFSKSGLKEVTLTRSITSIAEDAFEGCGQFKVNAPVGSYAYNWCVEHGYLEAYTVTPAEFFTYEPINGLYARITKYTGEDSVVIIPEEIDDYIVQEIGASAFRYNKTIEYVSIPGTVTLIGSGAFNNTTLGSVTLNEGITTIESGAFSSCNLTRIDFPDSVTKMADQVLRYCENLEYVGYPKNWETTSNSGRVFADCPKLTRIDVPEGTKEIPAYAFQDCPNLKIITLPEGLEHVHVNAFRNCTGLTEMVFPSTIKTVGGLQGCTAIQKVVIPEGAETIDEVAFARMTINAIEIPDSVKEIKTNAFRQCEEITDIIFGNGLTTIGLNAFDTCSKLGKMMLPDSVESIGSYAFANCSNLSEFKYPKNWRGVTRESAMWGGEFGHHFDNDVKLRNIVIPEGSTVIPRGAFAHATYLRKVTLPSTIKSIGAEAFLDCTAITELTLYEGIEEIGFAAFRDCSNLTKADFPDTVKEIGCYVFAGCSKLVSFHFPKSWTTTTCSDSMWDGQYYLYWGHHFDGCTSLKAVDIPEGATVVPAYAFQDAIYLNEVHFPSTLNTVNFAAFQGCTGIKEALLPDSVEAIGCYAFAGCTNLVKVHYPINFTTLRKSGSPYHGNYYFDYGHIFENCDQLKDVEIPEGVKVIREYVFYKATGLVDITVPSTLTEIENNAFEGCSKLQKIYLGYNVNTIGKNAFSDCSVLTIWTEYGATALQYAIDNNIAYYYLSLNGETYPTGIKYKGDDFDFYGFVRSNHNVVELSASVVSESSKKTVLDVDVQPNITMCDLSEILNSKLAISTLDLGEYTYSISASTDLDTETFIISRFTIVPAPLRSNADGIFAPCGSISLGVPFEISGIVTANYSIEKAIVGVYNTGGTAIYSCTLSPNTSSVDISAASTALQFSQMTSGQYVFRVYLTGNGETIVAYESNFTILSKTKSADREAAFNAAFNNSSYIENAILRVAAVEMADAAYHEWASKKKLEAFGFNFDEMETSFVWGVHGCPYTLGWKDIQNSNGTTSRLFAIVCTGTHINEEWISNVTVIDNGNFHYGFNTAAQRVMNGFEKYFNKKQGDVNISNCKVLVTGHSRGAAVANILAGYYLPQLGFTPSNIYAYTFACPAVYRGNISGAPYIYNYNLGGDLVGRVPFAEWGYTRFGKTIVYDNGGNLYGISVIDKDTMDRFAETLGSLSSENQMRFFQTMKNASGLIDVSNPVFVAYFALRTVVKECAEAYKVGSFHYNQLGNDTETVINGIVNTHQPSTYVKWISNM